ncbi:MULTISPECIES: biopolymer transporter ExbD [unclassified Methyloversatilis]|jgi:biopolymer transport protein ExbD|uniref:ExbD/TolR family protein n=1 Tax=unclassified Methyloversatilis TaxID=2639971 RepID=UPI001A52DAF8|nr:MULTISPECIES: biopolymer transporter ExbD [unclassified Methyloversatilis]MBL8474999.1 biopolymer transporter ExbD [Methyloversatilis sp.]MCQ9375561.1 biopolymer transporter ExbD [Methyloversatilis sp. XJ19-13]MCQ9377634.1 biopolymer transporter ExbD [Methyloversatilis sp. XJ19-49]
MQVNTEAKPYDSINVTPMLDLAYVLLVVFILMTTAGVQGLTMTLPKPSNKPSTEQHEIKIVQVMESGALMVNGVGVTLGQLEGQLNAVRARDPKFSVMIRGEARAPYSGVIEVIDLVNRMGIENVGLITSRIGT